MKHYIKNLYSFSELTPVPTFMAQRESFTCPHCSKQVVVAVQSTGIDYERVAKDYKAMCDQMWIDFNTLLKEGGCETIMESRVLGILSKIKDAMLRQKDL